MSRCLTTSFLVALVLMFVGDRAFAGPEVHRGHHHSSKTTISLDSTFPEKDGDVIIRANFVTVTSDLIAVMDQMFPGALYNVDKPIICHVADVQFPFTDSTSHPERIDIYLPLKDDLKRLDYSKFVYQLSHELGHVVIGASRTSGVFEIFATATSHEVLNRLADRWTEKYHINLTTWSNWGHNFRDYQVNDEKDRLSRMPLAVRSAAEKKDWGEVTKYLKASFREIYGDDLDSQRSRDLQALAAMMLRSSTFPWYAIVKLEDRTVPPPSASPQLNKHAILSSSNMPSSLITSLKQVAALE